MVNGLNKSDLKIFLDEKSAQYNCKSFIKTDPIQVPHTFFKKEDIERHEAVKEVLEIYGDLV